MGLRSHARVQFPLQGLTLDELVVDMQGGKRFNPGQAYVALSRVKSLNGLYQEPIKVDEKKL